MESLYPSVKEILLNNQQRLSYVDIGSGNQTLVFIHGMGSNLDSWRKNVTVLKNKFRCILIDLPGYGHSSKVENIPFSISYATDVILDLLSKLKIDKFILLGHSMGGQISIKLASRIQDKIVMLILMAPAGIEQFNKKDEEWLKNNVTLNYMTNLSKAEVRKMVKYNFHNSTLNIDSIIEERLIYLENPKENKKYCTTIIEGLMSMVQEKVINEARKITIPCLIIFGSNDSFIPHPRLHKDQSIQDIIAKGQTLFQNATFNILDECGHFPHWEKHIIVNQMIIESLDLNSQ